MTYLYEVRSFLIWQPLLYYLREGTVTLSRITGGRNWWCQQKCVNPNTPTSYMYYL